MSTPEHRIGQLSGLLERFRVEARVFYFGELCNAADFADPERGSHLHIVRAGTLAVLDAEGRVLNIAEPTLLFYPRGLPHRLDAGESNPAEVVCADVGLGGDANPLPAALPSCLAIPLAADGFGGAITMLLEEAFGQRCGRQAVLDRLCEVLVVKLLRHTMERGMAQAGLLAGLAHPALSRALAAIHEASDRDWSLERLAEVAGMSRTTLANTFREVVGTTPGDYLARWRLSLARDLIVKGRPLKAVAGDIGYESAAALSRAFARHFGATPRQAKQSVVRSPDS